MYNFQRIIFIRFVFSMLIVYLVVFMIMSLFVIWEKYSELNESARFSQIIRDFDDILRIKDAKNCYWPTNNGIYDTLELLEDVMKSRNEPKPGKSIFFHETSCTANGIVSLNARYSLDIFFRMKNIAPFVGGHSIHSYLTFSFEI